MFLLSSYNLHSDLLDILNVGRKLLILRSLLIRNRVLTENVSPRIFPIKHDGDLLQSSSFGLRENEIDGRNHGGKCGNVYKVELPFNSFQRNGVDVLIEEAGGEYSSEIGRKTFGAKIVWQNLDRVGDGEWGECNVVEAEKDEEKSYSRTSSGGNAVFGESSAESCDDDKGDQHTGSREKPERATTIAFGSECTSEGQTSIPELQSQVDAGLGDRAGDTDALENRCKIVRNDAIASPLDHETNQDTNQEAVSVALCGKECRPAS